MVEMAGNIRVIEGCRPDMLPLDELLASGQPALLKGMVRDWELVQAGLESTQSAMACLRGHYNGKPVQYGERLFAIKPNV